VHGKETILKDCESDVESITERIAINFLNVEKQQKGRKMKTTKLTRAKIKILHETGAITQTALSRIFGISQQQISNYCNNRTTYPAKKKKV
jgi:DNA-binding transcriptional regulator YiaG